MTLTEIHHPHPHRSRARLLPAGRVGSVIAYRRGAQGEASLRVGVPGRGGSLSQDLV